MNSLYDSDSSDGSSVWSSDSGDELSEEQLARGFFSQPSVYVESPRSDMFLRKNETRHMNRRATGAPILTQPLHTGYADPRTNFAVPADHDREIVGHLVDDDGKPYAEILERKPPPPNTNRHGQNHQRRLRRALGYDPHKVIQRKEVEGITNAHENLHGDAGLADVRRSAGMLSAATGDVFHNKQHTQEFDERDAGRSVMYDGHNTSGALRKWQQARRPLEHTWRHSSNTLQDPRREEAQPAQQAAPKWGQHATQRVEPAAPFRRKAAVGDQAPDSGTNALADLPKIVHSSQREAAGVKAHAHAAHGERVASGGAGRPTRSDELEHTRRDTQSHVSAMRVVSAHGDALVGDREIANLFSMPHEGLLHAAHAHSVHANVQLDEESTQPAPDPRFSTDLTSRRVDAGASANGTDAHSVEATRAHFEKGAATAHARGRDQVGTNRTTTDGVADAVRAGGGHIEASFVHIGDDRPPTCSTAEWHFTAPTSHTAGARHISNQECAASHGGQVFIDDRLSQPHAPDWQRIDQRVPARPSDQHEDRWTGGNPTERGANPIATQEVNTALKATHRETTGDSMECNAKPMMTSPLNLR